MRDEAAPSSEPVPAPRLDGAAVKCAPPSVEVMVCAKTPPRSVHRPVMELSGATVTATVSTSQGPAPLAFCGHGSPILRQLAPPPGGGNNTQGGFSAPPALWAEGRHDP